VQGLPSRFGLLARHAARRVRGRGAEPAPPRRGTSIERGGIEVPEARLRRYLAATYGSRLRRGNGADAILSPLACALWEGPLLLELLAGAGIPLAGTIHLGGETVPLRPLRQADRIRCRVEVDAVEPHRRGTRLRIASRSWNGAGQLCLANQLSLLLRGVKSGPATAGPEAERGAGDESDPGSWHPLAQWRLPAGWGRRYARASGDYNPIHLWGLTARPFGFRRPVLHGFCTESLVAHTLIERCWRGDPTALRRLRIRFGEPLTLPAAVCLEIGGGGSRSFRVVAADAEPQARPFAEGGYAGG
jgi:hypothetical protein